VIAGHVHPRSRGAGCGPAGLSKFLVRLGGVGDQRPPIRINPPYYTFDTDSLRNAALAALAGGGRGSDAGSLDSLVKALLERCSESSQVLMLDGFQGGLDAFHQGFWKPLLAAIRERQSGRVPAHRFVLLAALQNPLGDLSTRCCVATMVGHGDWVQWVCFSPGGQRIASSGLDQTIRVWDATTGHECGRFLMGKCARREKTTGSK
jgi:hypothetical protein